MTVTKNLIPNAMQVFLDANGDPLADGTVEMYVPNTTTPKATWSDPEGTSLNTHPIVLDDAGRCVIYGLGAYRQLVKDDIGNVIWDLDTVVPSALVSAAGATFLRSDFPTTTVTDNLVMVSGFAVAGDLGAGALYTSVGASGSGPMAIQDFAGTWFQLVINERAHGGHFGVTGDGVSDETDALQLAVDSGHLVYLPGGYQYLITGQVEMPEGGGIFGDSNHSSLVPGVGLVTIAESATLILLTTTGTSPFLYRSGNHFEGLTIYYPNLLRTEVTPTGYAATFTFNPGAGVLTGVSWHNIQFVNSTVWIDAQVGHLDFEYFDLVGAPVYRAIRSDGCGGTDRYQNISASYYYWCQSGDNGAVWMKNNAICIEIGRTDAVIMEALFFGNLFIGIKPYIGTVNVASGPYGAIMGLWGDGCQYTIYSEGTHPIGLVVTDFQSNSINSDLICTTAVSTFYINGGRTWGGAFAAFRLDVNICNLSLVNVRLSDYTNSGVLSNNISHNIIISNCVFDSASLFPVALESCNSLILSGNNFNVAPTLETIPAPATYYRARGNFFLTDATWGA